MNLSLDITKAQAANIYDYTLRILEDLPEKAVLELLGGYDNDFNNLIGEIYNQVYMVMNFPNSLDTEKLEYLDNLESSMDVSLKKLSYNYFKTTVLHNFRQGWRNLEWGNLIQLYPNICLLAQRGSGKSFETCYALPLWRLYSYDKPNFFQSDTLDNHNRKETLMVTNIEQLATEHAAKIIEEIKYNDIIRDKLNPNNKASLGTTKIVSETGSILYAAGFFGFNRGRHTGGIILDDCINESSLYSQEQREKSKERFYGTISPILEPGGMFVVSGTPMSVLDIYGELMKDKLFKVFEYPAVMPDGRILAPDRFTFQKLTDIRESVGSIVFSREYLVTPINSDSSIFPREFLERSIIGMENISLVNNIDEYPFKLKKIIMGCDFAISGTVGSDYSCFVVMGIDNNENYYLIDIWRKRSSSFDEQVNQIVAMNQRYRPNEIVCESNGFQTIMSDLVKKRGIRNIKEFVTTSSVKKNSYEGLPSISAIFERFQLKIPYAEGRSREMAEIIFSEFGGIGYIEDKGKLENVQGHDDTCMAMFFAITTLRENTKKYKAYLV